MSHAVTAICRDVITHVINDVTTGSKLLCQRVCNKHDCHVCNITAAQALITTAYQTSVTLTTSTGRVSLCHAGAQTPSLGKQHIQEYLRPLYALLVLTLLFSSVFTVISTFCIDCIVLSQKWRALDRQMSLASKSKLSNREITLRELERRTLRQLSHDSGSVAPECLLNRY